MAGKYEDVIDGSGEWFAPRYRKFKNMCCDCGLVHTINFRINKTTGYIEMNVERDNRATAAARRGKAFKGRKK